MSPLAIEILLWHYGRRDPYPWHSGGNAQQEIRVWAMKNDLLAIAMDRDSLEITDRGRALVEAMCAMPLPEKRVTWVIPK